MESQGSDITTDPVVKQPMYYGRIIKTPAAVIEYATSLNHDNAGLFHCSYLLAVCQLYIRYIACLPRQLLNQEYDDMNK